MYAPIVLVPGSGGDPWSWQPVADLLTASGYDVVNVALPADDDTAGLETYTDVVLATAAGRGPVVLAAASLGGFVAAMVTARIPIAGLALLNAMIPNPGETPGAWWDNVDSESSRLAAAARGGYSPDVDVDTYFFHDLPVELRGDAYRHITAQSPRPFTDPCRFEQWPDVPTLVLTGRADRFFPPDLQHRVARDRLGIETTLVPGGHLASVSHPGPIATHLAALADRRCVAQLPGTRVKG